MDIKTIINQRARLQSTQTKLFNDFGLDTCYGVRFNKLLKQRFDALDDDRKKQFIITLGGRANFKKTEELLNTL